MSKLLALLNPYMWIIYLALAASLIGGGYYIKHKYDEGKREEGRVEVRKEIQPKLNSANLKVVELTTNIETQNQYIEYLGQATKDSENNRLQAIKKSAPIVKAAKEKKTRLDGVQIRLKGISATCEDDLADINRLLGVK